MKRVFLTALCHQQVIAKLTSLFIVPVFLSSCAVVHKVQVGEVDSRIVNRGKRFELLVSETGVNVAETAVTASLFAEQSKKKLIGQIATIISLFQMGPRTGNVVFSEAYADGILDGVWAKCPSGRISGLMAVRESAKYPVVSGEVVRITGYCGGRLAQSDDEPKGRSLTFNRENSIPDPRIDFEGFRRNLSANLGSILGGSE